MNITNKEIEKLEEQYETITKQIKTLQYRIIDLGEEKKKISEKILKIKEELNLPKLIEEVKKIDTENLLSEDEIKKIYQGMDKTDYSVIKKKSWLDIDKLVNSIIINKKKYQLLNFVLVEVKLTMSEDRYPPNNYYSLKFKDSEGLCFIKSC